MYAVAERVSEAPRQRCPVRVLVVVSNLSGLYFQPQIGGAPSFLRLQESYA